MLFSEPRLPRRDRLEFFLGLHPHRHAPVDIADEDQVISWIVGRGVSLGPAPGAWTEMGVLVRPEGLFDVIDPGDGNPIQQFVVDGSKP